jgi:2,4-dienoyl-CoA reductase-like NADH-dependent reductase (Old Yellow Enzyme family)
MTYPRLAQLRTAAQFRERLDRLGVELNFDAELLAGPDAPLAQPYACPDFHAGNRFCALPMEGWDAAPDGKPTELVFRRWRRFGESGAKLIWGGEAVAISPDARANPNQLIINPANLPDLVRLRETLVAGHAAHWSTDDLMIGLQLTHSGRFCRPERSAGLKPQILYAHPILNRKFGLGAEHPLLTDSDIQRIIDCQIQAAVLAQQAGFHFVDIKHCHGYLGHEFLSAISRPGRYGGSFENRTRYLREIAAGVRSAAPGLQIGVRLSAFDFIPFCPGPDGVGMPVPYPEGQYPFAFGGDGTGLGIDLTEAHQFLDLLRSLGIRLVCITAGSPYYTPHIQRPALFPPSDGYLPPEDPLVGAARMIRVTAELKRQHPDLCIVGSGYSYLQEWLPYVAQNAVRTGNADFVGLGRSLLSYPQLSADVLAGRPLQRKHICRTFSDCTTAPRSGLVSGCYPLDPFYKERPEAQLLMSAKKSPR